MTQHFLPCIYQTEAAVTILVGGAGSLWTTPVFVVFSVMLVSFSQWPPSCTVCNSTPSSVYLSDGESSGHSRGQGGGSLWITQSRFFFYVIWVNHEHITLKKNGLTSYPPYDAPPSRLKCIIQQLPGIYQTEGAVAILVGEAGSLWITITLLDPSMTNLYIRYGSTQHISFLQG